MAVLNRFRGNKKERIESGEVQRQAGADYSNLTVNGGNGVNYRDVSRQTTPAQAAGINNLLHAATAAAAQAANSDTGETKSMTRSRGGGRTSGGTRGTYSGGASPTISAAAQTIQQASPLLAAAQQAAARQLERQQGGPVNPLAGVGGSYGGAAPAGATGMSTTNLDVYNQIQQMRYNADQWANASAEERKRLQEENERIGASIPGAYRDDSGVWHYGNGNLFDVGYQQPTVQVQPFAYGSVAESPMAADLYRDVQEARNRLNSRASFEYDPATDPLYRQYADSYTRGGQRAMTDVLGQLAARTGGMASSYAGAMAQQTYDNYMADLANKVPELYQAAYNRYNDEYNRERQAMLDAYGMYSDALGQYNTDRDFAYRKFRDSVGDQQWNLQNQYSADRDLLSDRNAERSWQHGLEREAVEDQRYEAEQAEANRQNAVNQLIELVNMGYVPTQADLTRTGLTMEQLQALINTARLQQSTMRAWR